MSDRGAYRGIRVVLIDGKDYQALSPHARLTLLTLKLMCGQAGICVIPALLFTLEEHTGIQSEGCVFVIRELQEAGWIKVERNIVWIVDGLKHEPGYAKANPNHQKSLRRYLDSLPHLQIVEDFRHHYASYPGLNGEIPTQAPSKDRVPAKAPPMKTWVQEAHGWWSETVGNISFARIGKALKPHVDKHGWEKVKLALIQYVLEQQELGKPAKLEWFAESAQLRLGKRAARPARLSPQEQAAHDSLVIANMDFVEELKTYKTSLNGGGEAWWTQMKAQAKSKNRHPVAFAHEWLREQPRERTT